MINFNWLFYVIFKILISLKMKMMLSLNNIHQNQENEELRTKILNKIEETSYSYAFTD